MLQFTTEMRGREALCTVDGGRHCFRFAAVQCCDICMLVVALSEMRRMKRWKDQAFIQSHGPSKVLNGFKNIKVNGFYTINHIHPEFTEQAHYTSAKFDNTISEFKRCCFTEEYIANFEAPFVKESLIKIGMQFKEAIPIPLNGTTLVIGEIVHLSLPDAILESGDVDLEQINSVGISGLNSYYKVKKIARYPFVRVNEVPEFR